MSDVALVIGIGRYQELGDDLPGSVADAIRFVRWLIAGAGVRPLDIQVLLSPRGQQDDTTLPASMNPALPATRDNIVIAANMLMQKAGNRLFVYFAGHGLTADINNAPTPVILPSDFTWMLSDKSITIDSLRTFFAAKNFTEQFFFIDACRDVKKPDQPARYGTFPTGGVVRPPTPQQFGIHATSPGLTANQIVDARRGTGAFSSALLDGLEGTGAAKSIDDDLLRSDDQLRYRVTYQSLFAAVVARVEAQRLPGYEDLVQLPRTFGEYSKNPELASFAVDRTSAADRARFTSTITVAVTPQDAPIESIVFDGPFELTVRQAPWTGELFQGTYWVRANAAGFVRATPWPKVELDRAPAAVTVPLQSAPRLAPPPPAAMTERSLDFGEDTGLGGRPDPHRLWRYLVNPGGPMPMPSPVPKPSPMIDDGRIPKAAPSFDRAKPVSVTAWSRDDLAMLELVGADGMRAAGFGRVTADVWPGSFVIRTRGDDGTAYDQPLDIDRSVQQRKVEVTAPPPKDDLTLVALSLAYHCAPTSTRAAGASSVVVSTVGATSYELALDGGGTPTATDVAAPWRGWSATPGAHALAVRTPDGRSIRVPVCVLDGHTTVIAVGPTAAGLELVVLWLPPGWHSEDNWRTAIIAQRALARSDWRWAERALPAASSAATTPTLAMLRLAFAMLCGTAADVTAAAATIAERWPRLGDDAIAHALVTGAAIAPTAPPLLRVLAERAAVAGAAQLVPGLTWTAFAEEDSPWK